MIEWHILKAGRILVQDEYPLTWESYQLESIYSSTVEIPEIGIAENVS